MALTDPDADRHARHSMVLVPRDAPGVKVERLLQHRWACTTSRSATARCRFTDVRRAAVERHRRPGRGVRDRPGPARSRAHPPLHAADRAGRARARAGLPAGASRVAFGKPLADLGGNRERIADARMAIEQARLLVLHDRLAARHRRVRRAALSEVSQIKVVVPNMAQNVVDMAIQIHGGGGLSEDFPLARSRGRALARCGSPTGPTRCTGRVIAQARAGRSTSEGRRGMTQVGRRRRPRRGRVRRRRGVAVAARERLGVQRVSTGRPRCRQFSGGASNLTYLLRYPTRDLVLRRPPTGRKAKSAHDMRREFTIQSRLAPVFAYVPEMVAFCDDESVIGSRLLRDGAARRARSCVATSRRAGPAAGARCAPCAPTCSTCWSSCTRSTPTRRGLDDLGKGAGYVARQVRPAGRTATARRARGTSARSRRVMRWLARQPARRRANLRDPQRLPLRQRGARCRRPAAGQSACSTGRWPRSATR